MTGSLGWFTSNTKPGRNRSICTLQLTRRMHAPRDDYSVRGGGRTPSDDKKGTRRSRADASHAPSSLDLKARQARLSDAVSSTTSYLSPFATAATQTGSALREGQQAETNRLLADLAPHIMRPRVLQAAAAASASIASARGPSDPTMAMILGRPSAGLRITNPVRSLLRFRKLVKDGPITSADLQLAEASNQILLSATLGDDLDLEPTGVAADASLLRGFQATVPSALEGRARRRKARGKDVPHLGLLTMGNSAQGLLADQPHSTPSENTPSTKDARKVRRANTRKRDIPLGVDELQAQLDEIVLDKENLVVRRVCILNPASQTKTITNLFYGLYLSILAEAPQRRC